MTGGAATANPDRKGDRVSLSPLRVEILFQTLREVGYQECKHWRIRQSQCSDCGAIETTGCGWMGGSLDFRRLPYDNIKPGAR